MIGINSFRLRGGGEFLPSEAMGKTVSFMRKVQTDDMFKTFFIIDFRLALSGIAFYFQIWDLIYKSLKSVTSKGLLHASRAAFMATGAFVSVTGVEYFPDSVLD